MSKCSIILNIITAVLWCFNCGYAIRQHDTACFIHCAFAVIFTSLAIAGIVSM